MRDGTACSVVLVLDENLSGNRIRNGLEEVGIPAKFQTDIVHRGATDTEVLAALASHPDLYLLSKDSDFHRKGVIREALVDHRIGAFIITSHKNKTAADIVDLVNRAWQRIQRCAEKHSRPFVAKILSDGHVEKVV